MYSDENKPSALATQLSEFDYVVIDTCSLMESSFPIFADCLSASKEYWKEGLEVIVPEKCLDELKKHSKDRSKDNVAKRIAAKRARKIIKHAKRHKLITLLKTKEDIFADAQIYNFVNTMRLNSKVLIITQDKDLTADLRKQNKLNSQHGNKVFIYRLTKDGDIEFSRPDSFNAKDKGKPFTKESKPAPKYTLAETVAYFDKRLFSNMSNTNYPQKKKENDIAHQIASLKSLGEGKAKELNLHYSLSDLERLLANFKESTPTPKKETVTPKAPKTVMVEKPSAVAYSVEELLTNYLNKKSVIVRDDAVAYFAMVHGPLDVTTSKLADYIAKMEKVSEERKAYDFFGEKVYLTTNGKKFFLFLEGSKPVEVNPVPPMPSPIKKPETKELPQKVVQKEETAPKTAGKSNRKIVQATPRSVVPKGATLIVGVPDNEKAAIAIERKVTRSVEHEAKQKTEAPKKAPTKAKSEEATLAFNNDRKLNANLNNPNFPAAKAISDIEEQIELLHKLKPSERVGLQIGLRELKSKLATLKKDAPLP